MRRADASGKQLWGGLTALNTLSSLVLNITAQVEPPPLERKAWAKEPQPEGSWGGAPCGRLQWWREESPELEDAAGKNLGERSHDAGLTIQDARCGKGQGGPESSLAPHIWLSGHCHGDRLCLQGRKRGRGTSPPPAPSPAVQEHDNHGLASPRREYRTSGSADQPSSTRPMRVPRAGAGVGSRGWLGC